MIIHLHVADKEAEDQRGVLAKLMEPSIIYTKGSIHPWTFILNFVFTNISWKKSMWQVSEIHGSTDHAQVV